MNNSVQLASFQHRLLASLIDTCVMWLLFLLGVYFILTQQTLADSVAAFFYLLLILINPLVIFRDIILLHYFGGSIGKLLSGLRVVNEHHQRLSFKRIFFRSTVGYSFSSLFFGLGFWSIIKDPKKQGWHDKAVASQVIVVQNLWPIGLAALIGILAGSILLTLSGVKTFVAGPLPRELKQIAAKIQEENDERISKDFNTGLGQISSYVAHHDYDQAKQKAEALLAQAETKHEKASAHQSLGIIAYYNNNLPEARRQMYAAAAIRPHDATILSWIAVIENYNKDYPTAEKYAREAVTLDPNDANYTYMLALVLYNEGQYAEAKTLVEKALQVYPENQEYLDLQTAIVKKMPRNSTSVKKAATVTK